MPLIDSSDLSYEFSLDELTALKDSYENCSGDEVLILRQVVHKPGLIQESRLDELPPRYRNAVENLAEKGLLVRNDDGVLELPDDLVYLPEGPGDRMDQLAGLLHWLPDESVRDWLTFFRNEDVDSLDRRLVYRRLASKVLGSTISGDRRSELRSIFDADEYVPRDQLALNFEDTSPSGIYRDVDDYPEPFREGFGKGYLYPVRTDSSDISGVVRAYRHREVSSRPSGTSPESISAPEKDWDRSPFELSEQLKVGLLVNDALPVRLTENNQPHRFDLKEAARITGWDLEHVRFLTEFSIEREFLQPGEDRFYITDRYTDWEQGEVEEYPFWTAVKPGLNREENRSEPSGQVDFGFGHLLRGTLEYLEDREREVTLDRFRDEFSNAPVVYHVLFSRGSLPENPLSYREQLLEEALDYLYTLGVCDRLDSELVAYRINERGHRLLKEGCIEPTAEEELPLILQPDGQLMLPLECSMEAFRHVNPFGLIVKVDRMIVYRIDDKSLVQALNEGWDARGFRDFLEENVRELPGPMEELFEDTLRDVEDVSIQTVHHLLEFETGATAAKAMNILNNYDPLRVDETTVVLRSSTTEETIYRNLSRGGVRLRTESDRGSISPLKEL